MRVRRRGRPRRLRRGRRRSRPPAPRRRRPGSRAGSHRQRRAGATGSGVGRSAPGAANGRDRAHRQYRGHRNQRVRFGDVGRLLFSTGAGSY
ncbi:hypothetical protein BRD02_07585 [Halobacteriales archaeon QS_8_69_73]|nr:MAG: hypothetical protein BRD02_07585 [Halobacteriales archaeon QS_8_69_73]